MFWVIWAELMDLHGQRLGCLGLDGADLLHLGWTELPPRSLGLQEASQLMLKAEGASKEKEVRPRPDTWHFHRIL